MTRIWIIEVEVKLRFKVESNFYVQSVRYKIITAHLDVRFQTAIVLRGKKIDRCNVGDDMHDTQSVFPRVNFGRFVCQ